MSIDRQLTVTANRLWASADAIIQPKATVAPRSWACVNSELNALAAVLRSSHS